MESLRELESDNSLPNKEKFLREIVVQTEHMSGNKNLIQMLMQEQMVHISKELDEYLR